MARVLTPQSEATAVFRELALLQEPGCPKRVAIAEVHKRTANTTNNNYNKFGVGGASVNDALLVKKLLANPHFTNFVGALIRGHEKNVKASQDLALSGNAGLQVQTAYQCGVRDTLMMFLTQPFQPDEDSKYVGYDQ